MEEIIKKGQTSWEVRKWISHDGIEFDAQYKCIQHEEYLVISPVITRDTNIYPFLGTFIFLKNKETLDYFIKYEFGGKTQSMNGKTFEVGDWVVNYYDYNPNGKDENEWLTLSEIQKELSEVFESNVIL